MTRININDVITKVQISRAAHQNQLKRLREYYDKVSVETCFSTIRIVLKDIFNQVTIPHKNPYVERALEFLAHFVADVTPEDTDEDEMLDVSIHPFLTMVIKETLKYHSVINENIRYNSCMFVKLILQHVGSQKILDNEICDLIEEAMLERTLDPKSIVRLQAVQSLIRLQDPLNPDTPVNKAYLSLIVDGNPQIRTEVVKHIAPYNLTTPQIVNRLKDIDSNVRTAALRRCADLGPKYFKIVERQHILTCGLTETNSKGKTVFTEILLPKWLTAYENNYLSFFNSLKLDADEKDITDTENIIRDILNLLLSSTPVHEISSILPLNENKVIPFDKLTSEAVAIWNILVLYLRENENMDDYLDGIIPDLTPFCNYIDSLVTEKVQNKMEDWEYLDYQYILNNLLGIAASYDFADEVGRKSLHQLCLKLLREGNLLEKTVEKIVALAAQTAQKNDDFTNIICHVISEIQEPLIEVELPTTTGDETDKECKKAELKVKIIRLEGDLEDATDNQEYLKAEELKNEINKFRTMLHELSAVKPITEMVKVTKDDSKTVCECLDILASMLKLPSTKTMTPSLLTVKDEFVVPLLNSNVSDINWRTLKCISLFCLLDRNLAEEYLKIICIPIITYRKISNYNKHAMMISVKTVVDMFRTYGASVFGIMENALSSSNQSINLTSSNRRRLYTRDDSDESIILSQTFHLESMIEVILDMLDDEICEIRNIAIEAISKLILNGFPVSPLLLTRLILKWYNPLTAQTSDRSQQLIGVVISNYAKCAESAKEIIMKAVIPTLQSITSAPRTSPLADVDVENLLLFFCTITSSDGKMDTSSAHINMAHLFTYEILKKKNAPIATYLSKLLLNLDISTDNDTGIKELIVQVETALNDEYLSDKTLNRNLLKFKEKLKIVLERLNRTTDTNLEMTANTVTTTNNETINESESVNRISEVENDQRTSNNANLTRSKHVTITNLSSINEDEEDDLFEASNRNNINNSKLATDGDKRQDDTDTDKSGSDNPKEVGETPIATSDEHPDEIANNENNDNEDNSNIDVGSNFSKRLRVHLSIHDSQSSRSDVTETVRSNEKELEIALVPLRKSNEIEETTEKELQTALANVRKSSENLDINKSMTGDSDIISVTSGDTDPIMVDKKKRKRSIEEVNKDEINKTSTDADSNNAKRRKLHTRNTDESSSSNTSSEKGSENSRKTPKEHISRRIERLKTNNSSTTQKTRLETEDNGRTSKVLNLLKNGELNQHKRITELKNNTMRRSLRGNDKTTGTGNEVTSSATDKNRITRRRSKELKLSTDRETINNKDNKSPNKMKQTPNNKNKNNSFSGNSKASSEVIVVRITRSSTGSQSEQNKDVTSNSNKKTLRSKENSIDTTFDGSSSEDEEQLITRKVEKLISNKRNSQLSSFAKNPSLTSTNNSIDTPDGTSSEDETNTRSNRRQNKKLHSKNRSNINTKNNKTTNNSMKKTPNSQENSIDTPVEESSSGDEDSRNVTGQSKKTLNKNRSITANSTNKRTLRSKENSIDTTIEESSSEDEDTRDVSRQSKETSTKNRRRTINRTNKSKENSIDTSEDTGSEDEIIRRSTRRSLIIANNNKSTSSVKKTTKKSKENTIDTTVEELSSDDDTTKRHSKEFTSKNSHRISTGNKDDTRRQNPKDVSTIVVKTNSSTTSKDTRSDSVDSRNTRRRSKELIVSKDRQPSSNKKNNEVGDKPSTEETSSEADGGRNIRSNKSVLGKKLELKNPSDKTNREVDKVDVRRNTRSSNKNVMTRNDSSTSLEIRSLRTIPRSKNNKNSSTKKHTIDKFNSTTEESSSEVDNYRTKESKENVSSSKQSPKNKRAPFTQNTSTDETNSSSSGRIKRFRSREKHSQDELHSPSSKRLRNNIEEDTGKEAEESLPANKTFRNKIAEWTIHSQEGRPADASSDALQTILQELSQMKQLHDVSSFYSKNKMGSRLSNRSRSSSHSSPIIRKQHTTKMSQRTTTSENGKRPTRGAKKKRNI